MSTKTFLLLLTCILCFSALVDAGVITQTANFNLIPNADNIASFQKFDTLGGTRNLTSIQFKVDLTITGGQIGLDNDDPLHHAKGTLNFGAEIDFSETTDVPLLDSSLNAIPTDYRLKTCNVWDFDIAPDNGDGSSNLDFTGPDAAQFIGQSVNSSASGYIGNQFLGTFNKIGSSTSFDILYTISGITEGILQQMQFGGSAVSTSGTISFIYNFYDPAPEPASIALLVVGITAVLKKRKNNS